MKALLIIAAVFGLLAGVSLPVWGHSGHWERGWTPPVLFGAVALGLVCIVAFGRMTGRL